MGFGGESGLRGAEYLCERGRAGAFRAQCIGGALGVTGAGMLDYPKCRKRCTRRIFMLPVCSVRYGLNAGVRPPSRANAAPGCAVPERASSSQAVKRPARRFSQTPRPAPGHAPADNMRTRALQSTERGSFLYIEAPERQNSSGKPSARRRSVSAAFCASLMRGSGGVTSPTS